MTDKPTIRITYNGQPAITVALFAAAHDLTVKHAATIIIRFVKDGAVKALPRGLDARTPLYPARALEKAYAGRPGRGSNLRGHG
jgi:hypothetical protein